jgi:hypothetical protein
MTKLYQNLTNGIRVQCILCVAEKEKRQASLSDIAAGVEKCGWRWIRKNIVGEEQKEGRSGNPPSRNRG